MRFTSVLKKLIVENSRFKVLYDKMVVPSPKALETNPKAKGLMTFDTFKQLVLADPDTKAPENFDIEGASVDDMEKVKIGKYTQWLLKNFVAPPMTEEMKAMDPKSKEFKDTIKRYRELFMEDLYKVTMDLEKFERAKNYLPQEQRDINKFTVATLFDTLKDFKIPEKKKAELEKKEAKKSRAGYNHAGGKIIYDGNDWLVIQIEDKGQVGKDAAIWYGGFHEYEKGETRWCTSSPGLSYFNTYIKDGPLYVIFPQEDNGKVGQKTGFPEERYQFHFPSSQFMNRHDTQIDLIDFLNNKAPELKQMFKSEFIKGLTSKGGGEKLIIEYPNSPAGKFIALYGFDEIFNSSPDNLTTLRITNTSNKPLELEIPESIGKFKSLESLTLDKVVKTLPKSISNLVSLTILSLPNNPSLESLPESLNDLQELAFLNLKNSNPGVKIPESLRERLMDQGDSLYYIA
jgi:hypothetical protein